MMYIVYKNTTIDDLEIASVCYLEKNAHEFGGAQKVQIGCNLISIVYTAHTGQ